MILQNVVEDVRLQYFETTLRSALRHLILGHHAGLGPFRAIRDKWIARLHRENTMLEQTLGLDNRKRKIEKKKQLVVSSKA